jgi:ketosteroid isomerase-like protein
MSRGVGHSRSCRAAQDGSDGPVYGVAALADGPNRPTGFGTATVAREDTTAEHLRTARSQEGRMSTATSRTPGRKPAAKSRARANKTALAEAIAALNAGDAEEYLALYQPDAELHGFPAGIEDVDALCRFHAATADTFPDASVTLDDAVAERDRVATRFTWRASQGPGLALVAQGGAIVRFADGQIAECWNLPAELHAVAS